MVVTGGNCSKVLKSRVHVPSHGTFCAELIVRKVLNRKGWRRLIYEQETSKQSIAFGSRRISSNFVSNLPKNSFPVCVISNYRKVRSLNPRSLWGKERSVVSSGGKRGSTGQAKKDRFQTRSHGRGMAGKIHVSREVERGPAGPFTARPVQDQFSNRDGKILEVLGCGMKQTIPQEGDTRGESSEASLSERLREGLSVDQIPSSELLKIQELKFSGDMWEGDSGPQVLDLQRALYWFGYLPKRTSLTAYFGPETKTALQQFQISHRVLDTGVWGSSSRRALWEHLCEERCQLAAEIHPPLAVAQESGAKVPTNLQPVATLVDSFSFQNLQAVGETHVGVHVAKLLNRMGAQGREFFSTVSSAPQWKHVPFSIPENAGMVGLLFVVVLALFGLGYSVIGLLQGQNGQPVRRRVMKAQWRDDVRGTRTRKHLGTFPGLDQPLVKEEDPEYPNYRLRFKSKPSPADTSGRTDRLIMYEGQVIVGDSPPSHPFPFRNGPANGRGSVNYSPEVPPKTKTKVQPVPVLASADHKRISNVRINGAREEFFPVDVTPSKRVDNVKVHGSGVNERSNYKSEPACMANPSQKASKENVPQPAREKSDDMYPNLIRNFLSALFTPRGLGQPLVLEKPSKMRVSLGKTQSNGRSRDREGPMQEKPERKDGSQWQDKDEVNLRDRVEELRKAVQATEQNRQAAMRALSEERQRSLELQVKISRQKEAAVALEEEVRVLKESHDALLASLRKKYSSSVAARAAAALLYQNWDTNHEDGSPQTVSY